MESRAAHLTRSLGRQLLAATARHEPLRRALRAASRRGLLPQALWSRLPVEGWTEVEVDGGRFAHLARALDGVSRTLYWRGLEGFEPETVRVFISLVKGARHVVDVGAHAGLFTLCACAVSPGVEVTAFEPVPALFEALSAQVAWNGYAGRAALHQAAVSEHQGRAPFHVPAVAIPSSASLDPAGFRGQAGRVIEVEVTTLDAACGDGPIIDLVKIDVEGFEHKVLQGMPGILATHRPALIVECNPDGPLREVQTVLEAAKYRAFHLLPQGPTPRRRVEADPRGRYRNYLFLPQERDASQPAVAPRTSR